jgi:hypothetical protein
MDAKEKRQARQVRATAVAALAAAQTGVISRRQLLASDVDRGHLRNQVAAGRWIERSSRVISTTTGDLTREQLRWLGVLHAGGSALVGGVSAAEVHGLKNWHRDDVTIYVEEIEDLEPVPGIQFVRTRRDLALLRANTTELPVARIEPAVLIFAAHERSERTAQGLLAAAVQQRLTTADALSSWVDRLRPLRRAPMFRGVLADIQGGSHSVAELDVVRLCRRIGLRKPDRQTRRKDAGGRSRFTDCEWSLADGRVLVLEVDGSFHMDVEHWEDDLARQRTLTSHGRLIVRCTARELRDDPDRVARDLIALGVPAA